MEAHTPLLMTRSIEDLFNALEVSHATERRALIATPSWPTELPKALERRRMGAGFVYREALGTLWEMLKNPVEMIDRPGLVLMGAPGVGKSVILYLLVLLSIQKKYVVVYIPRADKWNSMNQTEAVLYFAHQVYAALVAAEEQIPTLLQLPADVESWLCVDSQTIGPAFITRVMMMLSKVRTRADNPVPVIFAIDEVNGLTPEKKNMQPWATAYFHDTDVFRVVSGTPDASYHSAITQAYYQDVIWSIETLSDAEFDVWIRSGQFFGPLAKALQVWIGDGSHRDAMDTEGNLDDDPALLQGEANALLRLLYSETGGVPRDLIRFCNLDERHMPHGDVRAVDAADPGFVCIIKDRFYSVLNQYRSQAATLAERRYSEWMVQHQQPIVIHQLNQRLLDIMSGNRTTTDPSVLLQALGLVYTIRGHLEITPSVARGLWNTVIEIARSSETMSNRLNAALSRTVSTVTAGGDRGYAWEELIYLALLKAQSFELYIAPLDKSSQVAQKDISIKQIIHYDENVIVDSWIDLPDDALIAFQREGEVRVDYLLRTATGLIFLECTVSDYRSSKIPPADPQGDTTLTNILRTVTKWCGSRHFEVKLDSNVGSLTVERKGVQLRTAPQVPTVDYLLVVPKHHRVDKFRAKRYSFIGIVDADALYQGRILSDVQFKRITERYARPKHRPTFGDTF